MPLSTASVPPRAVLSGRAAVPATAILLCYLLGSGAFASLVGGSGRDLVFRWMDSLCLRPRALSGLLPLHPRRMAAAARAFPWLGFFILCIACLYCTALLYSPLAVLCRALILSSRPMAITLLWVAVQEGMGARDLLGGWLRSLRPCSSWPSTAPSIPSGLSGSPGQMDSVVNAVMLVTAFAMTLGMLWFVRLRLTVPSPQAPECAAGAADVSRFSPPWPMPMG